MPSPKQTIHTILDQFREETTSNRELGDRFERLICRYLELDPMYVDRFSSVWMWNEFPKKGNVGDVGIDIVAEERATGEYCAIQCKFYCLITRSRRANWIPTSLHWEIPCSPMA